VVQDAARSLRGPGQVLHLVGYEAARATMNDKPDQRDGWWARFAQLTGQDWRGLPTAFRADRNRDAALADITDQPLLNFLLASTVARGLLPADRQPGLAGLYDTLLHEVYDRRWGEQGVRPGLAPEGSRRELLSFQDFDELLQAIALAAWHQGGRAVTETEGWRYAEASNLADIVARLRAADAKGGLHGFLVAFYARRSSSIAGEPSFEFTHKSFAEYLAARRAVREVIHAVAQLARQAAGRHLGWTPDEALKHLAAHFGPRALDSDLLRFVPSELARQLSEAGNAVVTTMVLHEGIVALLNRCFRVGAAIDTRFAGLSGRDSEGRSLANLESSLFILRTEAALLAKTVSEVDWPSRDFACQWIQRCGHPLIHRYLSSCIYFQQNFYDLVIGGASWTRSSFIACSFKNCQLVSNQFVESIFETTTMVNCRMIDCYFDHAAFSDVIIGVYTAKSWNFGHETIEPRIWNLIRSELYVDGPQTPRTPSAPPGWTPPVDSIFSRYANAARFRNVLFIRCLVALEDEADDDPESPRYSRVTLLNCILQRSSPLVALARQEQTPRIKGENTWWQVYCLPDGSMPFGDTPPDELPLP